MHFRQLRHETPRLALPLQWYGTDITDMYNPRKVARDYGVTEEVSEGLDIEDLLLGSDESDKGACEFTGAIIRGGGMIQGEEIDHLKKKGDTVEVENTVSDTILSRGPMECVGTGKNYATNAGAANEKEAGTAEFMAIGTEANTSATLFGFEKNASKILELVTTGMNMGETFCDVGSAEDFLLSSDERMQAQSLFPLEDRSLEKERTSEVEVEKDVTLNEEKRKEAPDEVKTRERIEKIRRRRERNRACARRSNLRAKIEREQLLSQLNTVHKRVGELRGYELGLRRENLRLRRLLERGDPGSQG